MKSPRRNKPLESLARSIMNSDEFVTHVCNVAAAYGKHHAFDAAANRDVRQSLRSFSKHAAALSHWLQSAARGPSIEGQALRQIGLATRNPGSIGQSVGMRAWLVQVAEASTVAAEAAPATAREDALRAAAEGLRATFEHHGLKLSQRAPQQQQSDAVRLLCALVNVGGVEELAPGEARQWFKSAKSKAAPPARKAAAPRARPKRRAK